jgi:hypothetical protein
MPKLVETITIEEREILVFKRRPSIVREICVDCGVVVSMITPAHAAFLTTQNIERIFLLMQNGEVHHSSHGNGKTLVCLNSLSSI